MWRTKTFAFLSSQMWASWHNSIFAYSVFQFWVLNYFFAYLPMLLTDHTIIRRDHMWSADHKLRNPGLEDFVSDKLVSFSSSIILKYSSFLSRTIHFPSPRISTICVLNWVLDKFNVFETMQYYVEVSLQTYMKEYVWDISFCSFCHANLTHKASVLSTYIS